MPEKVKIRFEGKEYNINKSYVEGLRGYERRKQIKSIIEGKDRPKVKGFKSKRSTWATKFEDKYGTKISDKEFITKNIISETGREMIIKKGKGAYFSAGSKPNQNAFSWALARLASVIMGGPARKVDQKIWDQYKI
jgi:hypothetical protein|tara:strand:+ start:35 stop:442 length:408 start_codon:yes stop_codon:yes gene_type:complete